MILSSIQSKNAYMYPTKSKSGEKSFSPAKRTSSTDSSLSLRKNEYEERQASNNNSVISQSQSYADSLRASRNKAKQTALEKKKLQYNNKKISSQIIRAKNSMSAKKAVMAAHREIQRLKALRNTGEYDDEELQISIDHAKAMEVVARKKATHLEQEEMVERNHGGAVAGPLERTDEDSEKDGENIPEDSEEAESLQDESLVESDQEMDIPEEYLAEAEYADSMENGIENFDIPEDLASDLLSEINDELAEMAEELDLTELASTMELVDPNMSEEDLKMLKIKHRSKEMKDIAKADADYLKAIFEKNEKSRSDAAAVNAYSGSGQGTMAGIFGSASAPTPMQITIPSAYGSGAQGTSFSITI